MTEVPDDMHLPPYVYRQMSRGRWRLRFERRGYPKRWLSSRIGTKEFDAEYQAALRGDGAEPKVEPVRAGTFAALVRAYERSATYAELDPATRRQRSAFYVPICAKNPNGIADKLTSARVRRLRDERAETPGAANNMVKALAALYVWGIEAGLVEGNPTVGVARLKPKRKGGHPAWAIEDVTAFRGRHPVGSKAHLALCLMLFTGARIGDLQRIGPHHVRNGWLEWSSEKGGVTVEVPILPPLAEAINAYAPPQAKVAEIQPPFLVTDYGRAHASKKALGNYIIRMTRQAGVEGKSAHGVRKALGGLLADLGCSEHEIMAVLGHTNPRTSATYTTSARRRGLAESAIKKMERWKW